ncbi:hypothetical protein QOZ94_002138 [Xanthobacter agilis]|uniref:Uncharacterized protein n=1 Tax=Xanthobacter agilis TaxID=47492 RepID=A0ABU0LDX0_XANAG|nr:hypothetical protein [Xanthobacter agilis]
MECPTDGGRIHLDATPSYVGMVPMTHFSPARQFMSDADFPIQGILAVLLPCGV